MVCIGAFQPFLSSVAPQLCQVKSGTYSSCRVLYVLVSSDVKLDVLQSLFHTIEPKWHKLLLS